MTLQERISAGFAAVGADIKALQQSAGSGALPADFFPVLVSPSNPCLTKTAASTLAVKAGTLVRVGSGYKSFTADTAVQMPASMIAGEDYGVWVTPSGTAFAAANGKPSPYVLTPAQAGAVQIGGFHYGLVAPGTTVAGGDFATTGVGMIWTQADVDKIAGINAHSIWDLNYRPTCDPRGMVRIDGGCWFDIYFCSTQHIINGTSRYNTDVASGTVPPVIPIMFGGNGTAKYSTLSWHEANEVAAGHGKRLLNGSEFSAAAFGVTEARSLGGDAVTIPSTKRQPGFTSRCGGEQMTGHVYTFGSEVASNGGSSWVVGVIRGATYGVTYPVLYGGARASGTNSGSRSSNWALNAWSSLWSTSLRAACNHYGG